MTGINACVIDIHPHVFPAEPMVVLIGFIGGLQIDANQNSGQVIGEGSMFKRFDPLNEIKLSQGHQPLRWNAHHKLLSKR